ncbi:TPA: hypothetical protein ACG0DR_002951 [Enterobacter asburiae]|nr:hypothetical protein [Enterobacter asburiae]
MNISTRKITELLILFIGCFLGVIICFLFIALIFDILIWLLTGKLDLTKDELFRVTKIGCMIGCFTGSVFVISRILKLKGF